MVIRYCKKNSRRRGGLMVELLVAIGLLVGTLLPVAYSVASERRLARACYQHAVAMEIVDGEIEVLAAGGGRKLESGTHPYALRAGAAANLPPGDFLVTLGPGKIRLEWRPAQKDYGGPVVREVIAR